MILSPVQARRGDLACPRLIGVGLGYFCCLLIFFSLRGSRRQSSNAFRAREPKFRIFVLAPPLPRFWSASGVACCHFLPCLSRASYCLYFGLTSSPHSAEAE